MQPTEVVFVIERSEIQSGIIIYTTKNCPDCKVLKELLKENNIEFEEKDLENKNNMADLVMENIATQSAPIIKIGNLFFELSR